MLKNKIFKREFWQAQVLPFLEVTMGWLCKILKFCGKVAIRIISAIVLVIIFVMPFLSNVVDQKIAQWHWYTACAIFLILLVLDKVRRKQPALKEPIFDFYSKVGEVLVLPVFLSIFVFNYYNIDHTWHWIIFAMVIIAAPCYFFSLFLFDIKHRQRSEEDRKTVSLNIYKYILLCWLYDLFYMAIFNNWKPLIYIFGIIAIVFIFYNLTSVFLNGIKALQFLLPFDLLFGIGLTVYLIYIIPDGGLRNIILTIVASVLGGLLTLVGVAWTIRHANAARQEDMIRLERERKEETRKKHIPYIRISFEKSPPSIIVNAHIRDGIDFESPEDLALLKNNLYYSINVHDFNIKNVSQTNIILKGVLFHQKYYAFSQEEIVEPGACCRVKTTNNYLIAMPNLSKQLFLIIADILGNTYKVCCPISYGSDSAGLKTIATINDAEYVGYGYTYVVSSAKVPMLIADEEY